VTGANGAIAMFKLEGGLLLNLYPRTDLAKDAAIPVGPPRSGEFSLAQFVRSREEVDGLLEKAASAGATVTPAHDRPWDIYSGYFRDPDGHLWAAATGEWLAIADYPFWDDREAAGWYVGCSSEKTSS
jgi:catechol 2,3-dioxygenase-like lactoylglutathione lyase family enzyme